MNSGMTEPARMGPRQLLTVMVAGLLCAVAGVGLASVALLMQEPRYRAETQLALLPGPFVAPQEIADSWEALSRGQAARIAAEVLGQRRWTAAVAQATGVPVESITITAGAVADTSLINIGVEAPSAQAAEQAADSLVREARPVVEQVSGPFALEVVQTPQGTAKPVGTPPSQLLAVASAGGLLIGSGGALMLIRSRATRQSAADRKQPIPSGPAAARVDIPRVNGQRSDARRVDGQRVDPSRLDNTQQLDAQRPAAQHQHPALKPPRAPQPAGARELRADQYFDQYPDERLPRRMPAPPVSPPHGVVLPNRPTSWPGSAAAPAPSGTPSPSSPTRR